MSPARAPASRPTLRRERSLLRERGWSALACVDEVGRGALCGPVTVGVVLVTPTVAPAPLGVRDAKLLTPKRRNALVPLIRRWAPAWAVGHASSVEIDSWGIIGALRVAALRAMAHLPRMPEGVLLDGSHDYLSGTPADGSVGLAVPVVPVVRADLSCAAVAAASILAKTTRDGLMDQLSVRFPDYGWAENSGYASPAHRAAIEHLGLTPHHRHSWNLLP
ncbi:MAG: hypothetical protein RLZ55_641 [Actinomycetota bacterium]